MIELLKGIYVFVWWKCNEMIEEAKEHQEKITIQIQKIRRRRK